LKNRLFRFLKCAYLNLRDIPSKNICALRSWYYSRKIDGGGGEIILAKPFMSLIIRKHKTSKIILSGKLVFTPHLYGKSPIVVSMESDSILKIKNDFSIGQGVRIHLSKGSQLTIGGRNTESMSGITSDTLIMVFKRIEIGSDFICAWNVFISDSDWHMINGDSGHEVVKIGNHAWVANSCSILKGSRIGNNCIVASHSKLINKEYPQDSLIAGIPGKIIKNNITWSRDLV
jgi:acetyltransferase-like isoleucine patch superfamily enzyme